MEGSWVMLFLFLPVFFYMGLMDAGVWLVVVVAAVAGG
jgi:hypothetical protein